MDRFPATRGVPASTNEKFEGRYDLFISTGYPSPYRGDGVFAVDLSCLQSGGEKCIERLIDGAHYEMVVFNDKLYAGSMDSGVNVLDLNTLKLSKIDLGSAAPLVRVFDGKLYVGTYRGKFVGDSWRWEGNEGEVYVCDDTCRVVYDGYAVSFSVNNGELIVLSKDRVGYKLVYRYGSAEKEIRLDDRTFTDMVVDWNKRVVFLSTYGEGVFYTTLDEVKKGYVTLTAVNDGLLTQNQKSCLRWSVSVCGNSEVFSVEV